MDWRLFAAKFREHCACGAAVSSGFCVDILLMSSARLDGQTTTSHDRNSGQLVLCHHHHRRAHTDAISASTNYSSTRIFPVALATRRPLPLKLADRSSHFRRRPSILPPAIASTGRQMRWMPNASRRRTVGWKRGRRIWLLKKIVIVNRFFIDRINFIFAFENFRIIVLLI